MEVKSKINRDSQGQSERKKKPEGQKQERKGVTELWT